MLPGIKVLKKDKVLANLIKQVRLKKHKPHSRYFESLCVAVINQQLSTKAADTIEGRFVAIFGGIFPKPLAVLKKPSAQLRKAGLSAKKVEYIKGIARAIERGKINFSQFKKMADEDIINILIQLKGIGRWSAEMFLMFSLARPDVFSHGDLGLQNAIKKFYQLDQKRHSKKYHALVESWRPHRTTAARYLWASLEK